MKRLIVISSLLIVSACVRAASPNLVLILIDDMGWPGTSVEMAQGVEESASDFYQTPNIEKLAKQGMRFSRAYSPGPMCTPSRAGILTGKTPAALHMTTPGGGGAVESYHKLATPRVVRELPTSETTIAELLKKQGYITAHFGKWHLGRVNPGQHGFDVHDGSTGNGGPGEYRDPNPKDLFGLTERAIGFIEEQSSAGKPFYLQLSHFAVHTPVEALAASVEKFSRVEKGNRHSDVDFAAMTFDLDVSIGHLLDAIARLGLSATTYVVLMSDNGGAATPRRSQNQPLAGGKGTLYEGGIRVPLIIRGPGIESGSFSGEPVTGCDLLPTFCQLAGAELGDGEGTSLVPLLTGNGRFQRPENSLLFHYPHYGRGPRQKPQSALILEDWKLVRDLETGTLQLFDLSNDLSETKDLSGAMPEKADELNALLTRRLAGVHAQLPAENPGYDPNARSGARGPRRR